MLYSFIVLFNLLFHSCQFVFQNDGLNQLGNIRVRIRSLKRSLPRKLAKQF